MAKCFGCDQERKLVKSHVIPRSFFKDMDNGGGALKQLANKADVHPKKRLVGPYDPNILCIDCEKRFGPLDDFGQLTLIQRKEEQNVLLDGSSLAGYQLDNVDGDAMRRFLVSVLWRASISQIEFCNMVSLGPHEARAKSICFGSPFKSPDEFSYVAARFRPSVASTVILNPHRFRHDGYNFICLYFTEYMFWVKTDHRPMPARLAKFRCEGIGTLNFVAREMEETKEYDLIRAMVRLSSSRN